MGERCAGSPWKDTKHTTAETIVNLYRTMREAAGDDMVILDCNAVNHLCAGLFEASTPVRWITADGRCTYDWWNPVVLCLNCLIFSA